MFKGIGEGFEFLYNLVKWLLIIAVPLAIWKVIDIVVWIFNHVDVTLV